MGHKVDLPSSILKWCATLALILAAFLTANDLAYHKEMYLIANIMWMAVSVRWKEPSLFVASFAMTGFYVVGLL